MVRRYVQRHQPDISWLRWLKAGVGAFTAFTIALMLGDITGASMIVAPMAASAVLIYGVPQSPFSQPAHVIGGHCVAAGVALAADNFLPAGPWTLAGTVAAIIVLLGLLRLTHPPAAATALGVMLTHPSWEFLFTPVLSSSVTLVVVAVLLHWLPPRTPYPLRVPPA
jgi:CBS-domain-containing membrane protein